VKSKKEIIKETAIRLILILILINIVVAGITYVRQLNVKTIVNAEFYQYVGERRQEYVGEIELNKEGEITTLKTRGINLELDSTPMYYQKESKALFPEGMEIVYTIENAIPYRMPRFSSILKESNTVYAEVGTKQIPLENCFLYDGTDLYFFIEPTTIEVGDEKYSISELSYVNVEYNGEMEIYNYAKDEDKIIDIKEKTVLIENGKYTIDLNVDSLKFGEKEQLILKRFDNIRIIEW